MNNKEKIAKRNKKYYEENKDEIAKYHKDYYSSNKEKLLKNNTNNHLKYPWKKVLSDIKQRCNNPNDPGYKWYGAKGIKCLITTEELKEIWYKDKAWLFQQPSIDRKNKYKNYTFDNCEFIEKSENSKKDKYKKVNQYDLKGIFIKSWNSHKEASQNLQILETSISNCRNKRSQTAGGFIWR